MTTSYLPKKITHSIPFLIDCSRKIKFAPILNIFLLFIIFINNTANAQVANYTFTGSSGTYSDLSSPTTAISGGWDDTVVLIPIGFDFKFNGTVYSNCVVSTNGFISFSTINPGTTNYSPISLTGTYAGAVAALGGDLLDSGTTNPITFLTTGVAPNRILTVQWKNARRLARIGNFNFQIKLIETTNVVQVVYGTCAPTGTSGQTINVQVGLRGLSNADFNNRSLTSDSNTWAATTAGATNTATCRTNGSSFPSSGRTFNWTPANCLTSTVQPTALTLIPVSGPTINGSFTSPSPVPNNYLVIANTINTAPTITNGTTYAIGSTIAGGGIVIDNDANTTFTTSGKGLALSTTYYFFVFSFNSLCNDGPKYNITNPLTGNTSTSTLSVCTPTVTSGRQDDAYVTLTSFIGCLNDVSQISTFSNVSPFGYQSFNANANKAIQAQGNGMNVTIEASTSSFMKAWIDWNNNGEFNDVGEQVYDSRTTATASTTFGFVVPNNQTPGNYRFRVRINQYDSSSFPDPNSTNIFTSCGNINFGGETEDYLITVVAKCTTAVTTVNDGAICGSGSTTLSVAGTGTIYKWYSAVTGGTLLNTGTSYTTPNLAITTSYFVEVDNCTAQPRIEVIAEVNPIPILNFTPNAPIVCGENIVLALTAAGDKDEQFLINENFESANPLGVFTNQNIVSNTANIDNVTKWQKRSSIFVPTQQTWFPAIASGTGTNKFAIATSDVGLYTVENALVSPVVNSNTYLDLTLSFDIYFSRYFPDGTNLSLEYVVVEVSTNGGLTYPNEIARYTTDQGIGTKFSKKTFNLNAFINNPNLRIRIRYLADQWFDGVAIDNIKLFGFVPLTTAFTWSAGVNAYIASTCNPVTEVYTNQAITTVYIKPSASQLEQGSYSFTATATLSNGCLASTPITVTNNSRIWKGTVNNNWNNAANWAQGNIPTINNCVIIPSGGTQPILNAGVDGLGKNLLVKTGSNFEVSNNLALTIKEGVTIETGGNFTVKDNSSLIQIDNVPNVLNGTGTFNYERTAPNIKGSDYVYWSSPVASQNINTIYTTPIQGSKYLWNTIGANANGGLGNWNDATGVTMITGQGYIVRGSSNYGMAATNIATTFSGVPNNGNITIKAKRGDMTASTVPSFYTNSALSITDDNWSLLGNPYPSAINGLQFLQTNASNLIGTLYLWRHLNNPALIASPFYQNFTYNYNSSDYLGVNYTGTTTPGASDIIKSGQAFMVQRIEGAQDLTGVDVVFNNAMRLNVGVPYANNNFYRNAIQIDSQNNNQNFTNLERHRIWLDIIDDTTMLSETTLLGYVQGATQNIDNLFDGPLAISNTTQIYSIQDNQNLIIQGRALPFEVYDEVQLGVNVVSNGNYKIALNTVDGLFESQNIYLEDKLLNITHEMKMAPYNFTSEIGIFNDRFIMKYANTSLAINQFETSNDFRITTGQKLTLFSSNQNIKKVEIFDLLGRKIDEYKNLNTKNLVLENLLKSNKIYIIKTTFENHSVIAKKVIF